MSGVIVKQMSIDVVEEMKYRHVDNEGRCKMGLEVYFPEDVGCDVRRRKRGVRSARRPRGLRIRISIKIRIGIRIRKERK